MTKIELDDVLKIIDDVAYTHLCSCWQISPKGLIEQIKEGLKQLANHNSTQFIGGNTFKSDEALGLGDAVNHVQQDEETSVTSTNIPVCKCGHTHIEYTGDNGKYHDEKGYRRINSCSYCNCNKFEPLTQGEKT